MDHIGVFLKDIYFNKKSGRLIFRHRDTQKYLFFQEGTLVHAKTNDAQELLGRVLFSLGKITEENFDRLDEYIIPGKPIGETLVKKGLITGKDLEDGLIYQMREVALNLFPVFNGEIKYQEIEDILEQSAKRRIDVSSLIEDGIRRMKYDPALKEFLKEKIPVPKSKEFIFHLTEEEKELLNMVEGTSSTNELLRESNLSLESYWKDLYLLYCLDLIDFEEEKAEKEPKKRAKEEEEEEEEEEEKEEEVKIEQPSEAEDVEKRIGEVLILSENIDRLDHYQILDVSSSSSKDEIKKSYFQLARRYHPDIFGQELSSDVREKIDAVFAAITKAYHTLSDEAKRQAYDSKRQTISREDRKNMSKQAERKFRQGKTLYDRGMYEDSVILLEEAVRLMPEKANYVLLLALSESKIPALRKRAEKNFLRSIKLESWNPEGYIGLGLLYKKEGLEVKSRKQFERALRVDPDHPIARKELGKTEKKDKKKMDLKDLLSMDIFGKKKKK